MNTENLQELINRYEANFELINNSEHDEIFKWRAVKCFQDTWFAPENADLKFSERFSKAKRGSSILIDNSRVSPTNGIVRMAEVEPKVEQLFTDLLFADDGGDLGLRQSHMDTFLDEIEKIRICHFPKFWKYKQDRHAVSCYLAMYKPEDNYIYKYWNAEQFARYIEYGVDIGSGARFSLAAYHGLCAVIVEALREHPSLLDKHFTFLSSECYRDESLHLLAFDLMYCADTYNFYQGMTRPVKVKDKKKYTQEQLRQKEQEEKQAAIQQLESEIRQLEAQLEEYKQISLLGVQVFHKLNGEGIVISQDVNRITVRFGNTEKSFIINKKYTFRPTFENDEEVVEAFTEYDAIESRRKALVSQLERLNK